MLPLALASWTYTEPGTIAQIGLTVIVTPENLANPHQSVPSSGYANLSFKAGPPAYRGPAARVQRGQDQPPRCATRQGTNGLGLIWAGA